MTRFTAILLTVLTGFSGLVYEVTWQKYLATLLGSQAEATAAILAIFLGGLSVGYSLFGRLTRRLVEKSRLRHQSPRLLFVYGLIEAGIGVYALLFPMLFGAAQKLSLWIPLESGPIAFGFDVLLSALLIAPPAVLMGATIPILTLALAGSREQSTRIHALIYGCNTAGACAGALAGAFFLIPRLGLDGVLHTMAALNGIAGLIFVILDLFGERVSPDFDRGHASTTGSIEGFRVYAAIAMLAGFAMMALQTIFNRIGALSFGSSHFTFAIIVAVFVLCIALGSLAVSLFRNISRRATVITQWVLVIYLAVLYHHVQNATYWAHVIRVLFRDLDEIFYPLYINWSLCVLLILVIPIGLSGALLPLLFHHLRGEVGDLGSVAGRLYSWNTLGSLVGALLGGYLLFFWFDLHQVYRIALGALVLEAVLLTGMLLPFSNRVIVVCALLPAWIGLAVMPTWEPDRLSAGLFRRRSPQANSFAGPDAFFANKNKDGRKVIFYEDGPIASVTVRDMTKESERVNRSIFVNGKSDGNLIEDYQTMALGALLPALMIEKPERAFVIGFGTGVTTGEIAALASMQEVDVAEISLAVIKAAPLFDQGNLAASKNPKVAFRRGDAYRTLMRSGKTYDIIVSEPSNPWVAGVEMLYSIEFLQAARSHLASDGAYAQWMHLYSLTAETIELVLRNYTAVFPHVSVWTTQQQDLILLGFNNAEQALDHAAVERRYHHPDISAGVKRAGIESFEALLSRELLPVGTLHAANLEGPLHTLRHPRLSDMAARGFITGPDVEMPKFPTRESAEIGARNSLLRRHLGLGSGPLPAGAAEIAARETCKSWHFVRCATLLAAWRASDPDSEIVEAVIAEFQRDPTLGPALTDEDLQALGRLYSGRPVRSLDAQRSLLRAQRLSELYATHYSHLAPFDRSVLRAIWRDCSAPDCAQWQAHFEKQLGRFAEPRRRELLRQSGQLAEPESQ